MIKNKSEMAVELINWYKLHKRRLPWRKDQDPYKIWISEIMLQQTRVNAVIAFFDRFLMRFPTIHELASSSLEEVYRFWEGLGYYSRARSIHEASKMIIRDYNGKFPDMEKDILSLPGIGDYTAGAILSIAFGKPYPAVDGNVLRVFSRLLQIKTNVLEAGTKEKIKKIVAKTMFQQFPSDYSQAIMELGALICLPKKPKCLVCPIQKFCLAYQDGLQDVLPVRQLKQKVTKMNLLVFWIHNKEQFLIHRRNAKGLLGGFWELPNILYKEAHELFEITKELQQKYCFISNEARYLFSVKHQFSHLIWNMKVYEVKVFENSVADIKSFRWIQKCDSGNYPISTAFRKILKITLPTSSS